MNRSIVEVLARFTLLPLLRRRYRVRAVDHTDLNRLRPPYLVISNHTNFWDPFWINTFIPHRIQFVTSDNIFRTPLFRTAMKWCGSIPKSKLMNDTAAVGSIVRTIRSGGVVGIFPEGARTYDGRTLEMTPTVSRLIKLLRVPVVAAKIRGGYLSRPRWARDVRRGEVWIEYRLLHSPESIRTTPLEQLHRDIENALRHDELADQKTRQISFASRRNAEYLERLLFLCPSCNTLLSLRSDRYVLRCTACEYAVHVDEFGLFRARSGPLHFQTLADWNTWQVAALKRMADAESPIRVCLSRFLPIVECDVTLWTGYRTEPLTRVEKGTAMIDREQIRFNGNRGPTLGFDLGRLHGMNVQNREKLEFYYDGRLFRLDFSNPRASSYLWEQLARILVETKARSVASAAALTGSARGSRG